LEGTQTRYFTGRDVDGLVGDGCTLAISSFVWTAEAEALPFGFSEPSGVLDDFLQPTTISGAHSNTINVKRFIFGLPFIAPK
jgi:hypothetical protein